MCLGELVINPHQQHMDAFYWAIDWEGMVSVSSLVGLLEKHFFPKWLQVSPRQLVGCGGTAGVTGATQEGTTQAGPQCAPFIEHLPHGAQGWRGGGPGAEAMCFCFTAEVTPFSP